jgi:hypothetical protein
VNEWVGVCTCVSSGGDGGLCMCEARRLVGFPACGRVCVCVCLFVLKNFITCVTIYIYLF